VRYVTNQFAHIETLERARRWLTQSGIDPARIEARTHGIFSLSVAVEPGESAEVQRIIDAAESSDPDSPPSIWDLASEQHVHPQGDNSIVAAANTSHSESFVVSWRPQDAEREVTQTDTELQKTFREGKD
jgi:hypothetical protein